MHVANWFSFENTPSVNGAPTSLIFETPKNNEDEITVFSRRKRTKDAIDACGVHMLTCPNRL